MADKPARVVSGSRVSGRLHLGNYVGALENWVRLQDGYECFFFAADWHGLTTGYEDTAEFRNHVSEMFLDFLAVGLDPERSVLFVQSDVKEHAELHLLLSMITPLSWLERVPTYKEQLQQITGREIATYGFIGYPVLQSADVLIYRGELVPVGEDQVPHLELCREIARRFNHLYGPVLPEPQALLTQVPLLPGIDGRKMSKSYENEIRLGASPAEIEERVRLMVTDPARVRKTDPGHPEVCVAYRFHGLFNAAATGELDAACRRAGIGCVECKRRLARAVIQHLSPIHERREEYARNPRLVEDIRRDGARKARAEAGRLLEAVREAMRI
ncbi:MAG: tryptophan--tRNA ligase [Bacillota bacterium]